MTGKKGPGNYAGLSSNDALYASRHNVIQEMPNIIDAIILKALDGSYQHAKFLLDFATGEDDTPAPAASDEQSLAALLMQEFRESASVSKAESEAEAGSQPAA